MEQLIKELIRSMGDDPEREGLVETPERSARALGFLTKGYNETTDEVVNGAIYTSATDEMVIVRNIELYSLCEHHILPFFGRCHVGYIPSGKVIGLSKIARVVDVFARRLQIQEELTRQIAEALMEILDPVGVGIIVEAKHLCMMMRGVEKQNSEMATSCMLGAFRDNSQTRAEFLNLIR